MKTKKALLLNQVDREDYWVSGFVFNVQNTDFYEKSFNEIRDELESSEFIELLINRFYLGNGLFNGDESFKLVTIEWDSAVYFIFQNENGDQEEFKLSADYVDVIED
jgi:hypothetical protein